MKTSETVSKISAALLKAQRAITCAAKDATNPHFKNKYADLPAVINAIKPALNDAGIMFMQTPSPSDTGSLALTTRLVHESGEWMEDTATVPLPKNDPQGYGSAMTYARRYSLAAITGLYQDDDDGNAASQPKPAASSYSPPPAKETPKPAPKLKDSDIDDVKLAMKECDTLPELQTVFAAAYKKANAIQQAELKTAYEAVKSQLTEKV